MATVLLGSTAPVQAPLGTTVALNGEVISAPEQTATAAPSAQTIVVVATPDEQNGVPVPLDEKLREVRNAFAVHSTGSAAWVEGQDDFFNQALAHVFACPLGRPADWDAPETPPEAPVDPAPVVAVQAVENVQVEAQEA